MYTVSGNITWCSHCGKQHRASSKKLKRELPYDSASLHPGIYLKKMKTQIQKDTCPPMFIGALFTIAKIWKQLKRPLKDEWLKKK